MKKVNNSHLGAGARLRDYLNKSKQPEQIVDLEAPSGFVYRFARPGTFAMLFMDGGLPQAATLAAVEAWQADGVIKPGDIAEAEQIKLVQAAVDIGDRILKLSREPKLVVGEAKNDSEFSVTDVPDADMKFLFAWVGSGGTASLNLANFSEGSSKNALASAARPKQRPEAE